MVEFSIGASSIGLGGALAVTLSYSKNKSIGYAIVHGIIGWLYVLHFYFKYKKKKR